MAYGMRFAEEARYGFAVCERDSANAERGRDLVDEVTKPICGKSPDFDGNGSSFPGCADQPWSVGRSAGKGEQAVFGSRFGHLEEAAAALGELMVQWQSREMGATNGDLDDVFGGLRP